MTLKDRILSERNFAGTLRQVLAYRKELIAQYVAKVEDEITSAPAKTQVNWALIGSIERQCALLEDLIEE